MIAQAFWQNEEFLEFLPYINATAAWDKRQGKSPRFDLKSSTPLVVMTKALAFRGPCADCGKPIYPFRSRSAEAKRGSGGQGVYLATCCPLDVRMGCSRGKKASAAYQAIWELIRGLPSDAEQPGLF